PPLLVELLERLHAEKLFFNRELEYYEQKREALVVKKLEKRGFKSVGLDEQLILPYSSFYAEREHYFKVFTPFKRHWLKTFSLKTDIRTLGKPRLKNTIKLKSSPLPALPKTLRSSLDLKSWPAGEAAALKTLR